VRAPEPCRPRLGGAGRGGRRHRSGGAMAAVAPPRIHGEGRREAAWRAAPWLAALPLKSPREVLDGCRRLVLLSPHPDDETLACGGLIRAARGAAVDIHLVAVT